MYHWAQFIDNIFQIAIAFAVAIVSGFISIAQRVLNGNKSTVLWVITEFATAILCGLLAWNAYPVLAPYLPNWVTPLMLTAVCAHSGGKLIQQTEKAFLATIRKFGTPTKLD